MAGFDCDSRIQLLSEIPCPPVSVCLTMKLIPLLLISLLLFSCQSTTSDQTGNENNKDVFNAHDVLVDSGTVTQMEDTGYPMFALDLKSNGTGKNHSFLLNIEDINLKHDAAYKLKGRNAIIEYELRNEPFVMDIIHKDTSLLGEYALPHKTDFARITGTISGANEESQGDFTWHVYSDETSMVNQSRFGYYIDQNLANINGSKATVYYELMDVSVVKSIKLHDE